MAPWGTDRTRRPRGIVARRRRPAEETPGMRLAVTRRQLIALGLFLAFTLVVVMICFVGQSPASPLVLTGQVARTRVTADFAFTYESRLKTQRQREEARGRVAPFYRLDNTPFEKFSQAIDRLQKAMADAETAAAALPAGEQSAAIEKALRDFEGSPWNFSHEDLLIVLRGTEPKARAKLFEEGLLILRGIFREGIHDSPNSGVRAGAPASIPHFFSMEVDGRQREVRAQAEEEALRFLRINLMALEAEAPVAQALNRILRVGLEPNLVYDRDRTEDGRRRAEEAVKPVQVSVTQGQTILEPEVQVSAEQHEQLMAYRKAARKANRQLGLAGPLFFQRALMALGILAGAWIYAVMCLPHPRNQDKPFGMEVQLFPAALTILLNLLAIRILLQLGDSATLEASPRILAMLPWMMPVALGPMIATLMAGPAYGFPVALVVSALGTLMLGGNLTFLFGGLMASQTGIFLCRDIRFRGRLVRIGAATGLAAAVCAWVSGSFKGLELPILVGQMITAILNGTMTGLLTMGLLPLLEQLFRHTSDITLLELTDFNHPLLRRLQMEAPGTYHHSLMVASLAERAAAAIGANPLICRATALFHDIGKMVKPEYFTENQVDGVNPHQEHNPSMSALVIKSHVKEGVEMARWAKLPKIFIDIIREHHGTSLIYYFYDKAQKRQLKQQQQVSLPFATEGDTETIDIEPVDESTFRYDGPRPQTRESAVIFFADSVEAASRSLKKVTPQSVQEMIDRIFRDKIEDGQLDECPLTMEEIAGIRKSFAFSLLNMLHARVEYPSRELPEARRPSVPSASGSVTGLPGGAI